ncbi:hypothetical protein MMC26_005936 [Xylographa opegraphella]|nr:hypothetical protein [Xylographa opegraphella]
MPAIIQGQQFPSFQAFKQALHEWAIERGFTPAILDSDIHRVRAGCRSGVNCPFRIRANFYEKKGYAKVTTCVNVHSCTASSAQPASQDIKRAEASKLKFLVEAVPKHMTVTDDTSTKTIIEIVKNKYGQDIALRQAQKVKALLCPKSKETCERCDKVHTRSVRCKRTSRSLAKQVSRNHLSSVQALEASGSIAMDWQPHEDLPQSSDQPISSTVTATGQQIEEGTTSIVVDPQLSRISVARTEASIASHPMVATTLDPSMMLQSHPQPLISNGGQAPQQAGAHLQWAPLGARIRTLVANPQPPRTPQEIRLEAARLMQNAARLMQEAARMNAEAARLTASVANV